MRGAQKIKAKRGGASSRGNSVGYQQFLSRLVEVKGVPVNCKKLLLTFWKVKHCKGGRGVRWSAATKQHEQKFPCFFLDTAKNYNNCWLTFSEIQKGHSIVILSLQQRQQKQDKQQEKHGTPLWRLLMELRWCLKCWGPQKCTFGVLCEPRRPGLVAVTPKRTFWRARPSKTPPTFNEKTPRESTFRREGKQRAKFWGGSGGGEGGPRQKVWGKINIRWGVLISCGEASAIGGRVRWGV